MKTKKNPLLLTSAICLIILALLSLGYALATSLGIVRIMPSNMKNAQALRDGNLPPEGFEGQIPEFSGNRQGKTDRPEGGEGMENLPEGFDPESFRNSNLSNRGTAANSFLSGSVGGWLGVGLFGLSLILAVIAGIGMTKGKKWCVVLGIVLALILLVLGALCLFPLTNWLRFAISLVKVLLGIAVIVLLLLPRARKAFTQKQDIFDEEDHALYYGDDDDDIRPEDDELDDEANQ